MARLFDGATQYLSNTTALLTAAPISMAGWAYKTTDAATGVVLSIGDTSTTDQFSLVYDTNEDVLGSATESGSTGNATTSGAGANNAWTHCAAVFRSATSRDAYRDGTNKGSDVTNLTPSAAALDRTHIGIRANSNLNAPFPGRLAEVALWNIALSDADVAVLAKGVSPLLVQPEGLVAYWPLIGAYSPEIDIVGGFGMTLNNAPTAAAHPRIIYPRKTRSPIQSGTTNATVSPLGLAATGLIGIPNFFQSHVLTMLGLVATGEIGIADAESYLTTPVEGLEATGQISGIQAIRMLGWIDEELASGIWTTKPGSWQ